MHFLEDKVQLYTKNIVYHIIFRLVCLYPKVQGFDPFRDTLPFVALDITSRDECTNSSGIRSISLQSNASNRSHPTKFLTSF